MDEMQSSTGGAMTEDSARKPTLVLGGTGKTGRRVVQRLQARGIPVRVGSRSGEPPFDWEKPATWARALDGVEAVYVSYYPDLTVPGAVETVGSFAESRFGVGSRGRCSCPVAASPKPSGPSRPCATRASS